MTFFELKRSGFPDLTFYGKVLAEQPGVSTPEKTGDRRHDIAVYRTDDDQLIVAVSFHTNHPGEVADSIAEVVNDLSHVEETLSLYDPEIHFDAASALKKNESSAAISRELTRRYDLQVNAILEDLQVALSTSETPTSS